MNELTLDREALALGFENQLNEWGQDTLSEYDLACFGEEPIAALAALCDRAFYDWEVLGNPYQCNVVVYELAGSDCPQLLIAVHPRHGRNRMQFASFPLELEALVEGACTRKGPGVLIDLLQAVVDTANRLLSTNDN
jgi:hypothetical protein